MNWRPGLDGTQSVGGFGFYETDERDEAYSLSTYAWISGQFTSYGEQRPLFSLPLPDQYTCEIKERSWTGMSVHYHFDQSSIALQLRTTLPGPHLTISDQQLSLRFAIRNDVREIVDLESGNRFSARLKNFPLQPAQFLTARTDHARFLLVSTEPITGLVLESGRHWKMQFAKPGARLLIVPLLNGAGETGILPQRKIWLSLAAHPPVDCAESFAWEDDQMQLRQQFAGAEWSPVPPLWMLMREMANSPVRLPEELQVLVPAIYGPYAVAAGHQADYQLEGGWLKAEIEPTTEVTGELQPFPEELAYAGDWTWEESGAMDSLLSLRSWAPLLGVMRPEQRETFQARIQVPSAKTLAERMIRTTDPILGRTWGRDQEMWAERGNALYDPDWYNGLMLSGLQRATECAEPSIAAAARRTASEAKEVRAHYCRYFELLHEWTLGMAWCDPRGALWLSDCCRNGMEGLVAEGKMREMENDQEGAEFIRYLAVKTGIGLLSGVPLVHWVQSHCPALIRQPTGADATFLKAEADDRLFATNVFTMPDRLSPITPASRNPYHLPGLFPEFASLIRAHGNVHSIRELAAIWEEEFPARYQDWITFYIGQDWQTRFVEARDQEARIQAAVFYHLEPEICTRLWLLEETPEQIGNRFNTPLNLAQQLLLRAGFRLINQRS